VFLTLNDESKVEIETMLVVVSNTPLFGKNFMVAPNASLQDDLMDISVYPDFSKAELLRYFAEVMDGGYSGDKKVQHYQARKLKVKTSPKLDVMADGVELAKGTVKIKVRPDALRVIAPESSPYLSSPEKAIAEVQPEPVSSTEGKNKSEESAILVG
jgi:diacylglycerol kinase family enzyme